MRNSRPLMSLFERIGGCEKLVNLLWHFYEDVRQHREIGPIFLARIDDWPGHLEKAADFWSAATGGPVRSAGPMHQCHFPLGLEEAHFSVWLDLWRSNCHARVNADAAGDLIKLAEEIVRRLRAPIDRNQIRWRVAPDSTASS